MLKAKPCFGARDVLDNGGGMPALGREIAEDLAATKVVRRAGLKVRLTPQPFAHPIGRRSLSAVWSGQLRWARIRRSGVFWLFLPEITHGPVTSSDCGDIFGGQWQCFLVLPSCTDGSLVCCRMDFRAYSRLAAQVA